MPPLKTFFTFQMNEILFSNHSKKSFANIPQKSEEKKIMKTLLLSCEMIVIFLCKTIR